VYAKIHDITVVSIFHLTGLLLNHVQKTREKIHMSASFVPYKEIKEGEEGTQQTVRPTKRKAFSTARRSQKVTLKCILWFLKLDFPCLWLI